MGSQKEPQVKQETVTKLSPQQEAIYAQAFPYAQQYAKTPIQQYGGSGIAGFNPLEIQGQQGYVSAVPGLNAAAGQAQTSNNQLMDPNFMLNVADNQYLRNAINANTADMTRNLNENILPGIRGGAIQAGGMYSGGNTRAGIAEGEAIGRTSSAASDSATRMMFDAYNRGLTGMGEAINRNPQVQMGQLFGSDVLGAVGGQQRMMEQARLDEDIARFYTGQALPLIQAKELISLIQGMPGGGTVSTATGAVPKVNPYLASLGMILNGAANAPKYFNMGA